MVFIILTQLLVSFDSNCFPNNAMDVTISHCGSAVADTYLYLLDSSGKLISSNDNYSGDEQCSSVANAYLKMTDLAAGTYYIVSEGNTQNGNITTTVNGNIPYAGFESGQNQNYIIEITPTVESSDARGLSLNQSIQKIQYYDGLGRPSQSIQRGFSLNNNDLITLQEYDNQGRESNAWLPTPYSASGSYTDPATIKSEAITATVYNDSSPYSSPVYETSPLNIQGLKLLQWFMILPIIFYLLKMVNNENMENGRLLFLTYLIDLR